MSGLARPIHALTQRLKSTPRPRRTHNKQVFSSTWAKFQNIHYPYTNCALQQSMLRCIIRDRRRNRESSREKACTTFALTATASSAWCGIATPSNASVRRNASTSTGSGFERGPISAEAGWILCGRQASTRRPTPRSNQRLSRLPARIRVQRHSSRRLKRLK